MTTQTTYIQSEGIDEKSFYIDVLYYSYTSISKSLEPTITKLINKYAHIYFKDMIGKYEIESRKDINIDNIINNLHSSNPYYITRIIIKLT